MMFRNNGFKKWICNMASSNGYFNCTEAAAVVIRKMYKVYSAKFLPNVSYKLQDVNCATKLLVASILIFNIQCTYRIFFYFHSVCLLPSFLSAFPPSNSFLLSFHPRLSVCRSVCLFVCSSVCLSVCLSACLSVCLSVCLPVCLSVFLSLSGF